MQFEVKRSEGIKVKIYETEYVLKKPSVKAIKDYALDLEKVSTAEKFDRAKTLLTGMGLKPEVVDEMEFDHLQELIEFLTESMAKAGKKN